MTFFNFFTALVAMSLAMSAIMAGAWLVQQRSGNSGWVDTIWTFGVGLTGAAAALASTGGEWPARQFLVASFAAIWTLRLGVHIASRSAKIPNDPRYAEKIKAWGSDAPRRMFWFLQIQALAGIPLVMSMFVAAHRPGIGVNMWDAAAILIMAVAVFGEGLADWQLHRFKSNHAIKVGINDVGLWKWSRHPNYFFEALGWLAYPLIAIDLTGQYPWGFLALAGPACMVWLLVYVSGIPPLEEHMLRSRGEAYRAYQRRTNAFFPGPPRN
jgi:steroid 5-alpha reductase family enzyme